jgi:hypothetical protein
MRAGQVVKAPFELDAVLAAPEKPDHLDRLLEGGNGLPRSPGRAAVRMHRGREASGAKAELEPSTAEQIDRGRLLRQQRRRMELHVRDIGEHRDALGPRGHRGEQGHGVVKATLIGMVLDAGDVEPQLVRNRGKAQGTIGRLGRYEHAKANGLSVVHPGTRRRAT